MKQHNLNCNRKTDERERLFKPSRSLLTFKLFLFPVQIYLLFSYLFSFLSMDFILFFSISTFHGLCFFFHFLIFPCSYLILMPPRRRKVRSRHNLDFMCAKCFHLRTFSSFFNVRWANLLFFADFRFTFPNVFYHVC